MGAHPVRNSRDLYIVHDAVAQEPVSSSVSKGCRKGARSLLYRRYDSVIDAEGWAPELLIMAITWPSAV